jgi:aldose 1-epimerase
MAFTIDINEIDTFKGIRIKDSETQSYIEIITKGGLLNAWVIKDLNQSLHIIASNDFSNGWKDFETNGFKSGKMSPFACRLNKGKYSYGNKEYNIDKFYLSKHAIHGILYDAPFSIISTSVTEEAATVSLQYHYNGEDAGFPFKYSMEIKWGLQKNNLVTVQTTVTNNSAQIIPMTDGWHPYFMLGTSIDDCVLSFTCAGQLEYDADLLPTRKIVAENSFEKGKLLNGIALDNGYLMQEKGNYCTVENAKYKLQVTPITNYPYLQLYTPPDRKSIAIENLSGAPDCFNNKMGLQELQPQKKIIFETAYQFIKK